MLPSRSAPRTGRKSHRISTAQSWAFEDNSRDATRSGRADLEPFPGVAQVETWLTGKESLHALGHIRACENYYQGRKRPGISLRIVA